MHPHEELRSSLNCIIDSHRVGHDHRGIAELTRDYRAELYEWFNRSPSSGTLELPARQPEGVTMLTEDRSALRGYAAAQGLGEQSSASLRLEGTWCLWTIRPGIPDHRTLVTGAAIDSNSALRTNVAGIIDHARRVPCDAVELTLRLHKGVSDWQTTLQGDTTARSLSDAQIRSLGTQSDLRALSQAALGGDIVARRECLSLVQYDELDRAMNGERSLGATWSMWTSKGHPDDRRLAITRQAIDAHAFHELHPDRRTRYVSFDGPETPTRNAVLNRAISLMPPGSTVVVATDKTPEGRALEGSIEPLRARHPTHTFVRQAPELGYPSWHEHLRGAPSHHRHHAPTKAPKSLGLER